MELYLYDGMYLRRENWTLPVALGKRLMRLDLQFGFGMMEHSRALIDSWRGGNVILSPRDLTSDQLDRLSSTILAIPGGTVWLDPQFYVPRADHERLCSHDYWPSNFSTGVFWQGAPLQILMGKLIQLNAKLRTSVMLLPGMLASSIDEDWLSAQEAAIEAARALGYAGPLISTIALSDDAVKDINQISELLERAEDWSVDGFYIVAQHPGADYLVTDPIWLANLLDLSAGLKLMGKFVSLGYCTHQMLIGAAAKLDAISSGTWMNVRSFPPEKFSVSLEEEIKQRTKWYYCPQALSEYKIPFLDVAFRQGILQSMKSSPSLGSTFADLLFSGVQPTTAKAFSEQSAFRHYLQCLKSQATAAVKPTFRETVDAHLSDLNQADKMLRQLRGSGVLGGLREFTDALDANRSALQVLISLRGPTLERNWPRL